MENYIVRIYRRVENDPRILVGVVEEVGVEGNKAFTNLEELWKILNPEGGTPKNPGGKLPPNRYG